jgi:tellurite resistance protein TerC
MRRFGVDVSSWVWAATLIGLTAVIVVDLAMVARRPHEPSMRESSIWVAVYVTAAVLFGLGVWSVAGAQFGAEFFAGWLTEYSLSIDNLFVFVIIMSRFGVPRAYQQKMLLIGIVLALVLRGAFIAAGAALIHQFVWVFYIFGAFLVYTAAKLVTGGEPSEEGFAENRLIRTVRRVLPITTDYRGASIVVREPGRGWTATPLFVVLLAIGTTDLLFALDSIPAIFGLTTEPYLVFTANVFALMGLRQLYFLLGGLLERLRYLSHGLALVLAFIGVKLVFEALHSNNVPFINGGEPVAWAPEIPIWLSLGVIVVTLMVTTVASLLATRRERQQVPAP